MTRRVFGWFLWLLDATGATIAEAEERECARKYGWLEEQRGAS